MPDDLPANASVADAFDLLGDLLELEGAVRHRVLAYRRGASRVRGATRSVAAMALEGRATDLPDIGATLQAKIVELATTGRIEALEKARARVPEGLVAVARLEGLGPKRALTLWRELGVTDMAQLEAAARDGRLAGVPGVGPATVTAVLAQLDAPSTPAERRVSLGVALPQAQLLAAFLQELPGVHRVEVAGSLRRGRETVHDADVVVAADDGPAVLARLADCPLVASVAGGGDVRAAVVTQPGLRIEVAVSPPERFGNLLQHATGSAAHNVRLQELALRAGLSMSEYGLTDRDGHVVRHAGEEDVYAALGLAWIPPELREDRDELARAATGPFAPLVEYGAILGDLHVHSDWSDGRADMATMAAAARARGYAYLGFADHSPALAMARGLRPDRVRRQWEAIDELNARMDGITLLKCTEVDILADGRLDHDDELLAGSDFVVASLHSGLGASGRDGTARVLAAIDNPHVDAIGHPTGRRMGRREGVPLDIERIAERAAATGTLLEINGQPARLDLDSDMARVALAAGVRLLVSSDAHAPEELWFQELAVRVARRAGAEAGDVANTRAAGRWRE
ncbi:MAG: helix-hairpin-helix domain-containing protein [Thermoleophilia bacterium]